MVRIGKKIDGEKYTKRRAAYVIIEGEDKEKIAIATDGEWFFLGGGLEGTETELEALKREVIEESGYSLKNIRFFDTAWADGGKRGPLDVEATFYIAEFGEKVAEPIEKDHKVFWIKPAEYTQKLYHEYQRYVLNEYIEYKKSKT